MNETYNTHNRGPSLGGFIADMASMPLPYQRAIVRVQEILARLHSLDEPEGDPYALIAYIAMQIKINKPDPQ